MWTTGVDSGALPCHPLHPRPSGLETLTAINSCQQRTSYFSEPCHVLGSMRCFPAADTHYDWCLWGMPMSQMAPTPNTILQKHSLPNGCTLSQPPMSTVPRKGWGKNFKWHFLYPWPRSEVPKTACLTSSSKNHSQPGAGWGQILHTHMDLLNI